MRHQSWSWVIFLCSCQGAGPPLDPGPVALDGGAPDTGGVADAAPALDAGATDAGRLPDAGDPPEPLVELTVDWQPCALETETPSNPGTTECALVDAPRQWSQPESPSIKIGVKRFRPSGGSRGQLWLLIGGPGLSSVYLEGVVPYVNRLIASDLDLYMLDYRGVGRGDHLECPAQQSLFSPGGGRITTEEWPECVAAAAAASGGDLSIFLTENVARDLGGLIRATRGDGEVYIYGISYGTAVAQWYLALFPDGADGVVMDGVLPRAARLFPSPYARNHDRVGRALLDLCGAHARCSSMLGPDPWARLGELRSMLDAGHCPDLRARGMSSARLADILALLVERYEGRDLVPAILHRLLRCRADDVTALQHLLATIPPIGQSAAVGTRFESDVLYSLLVDREFLEEPVPTEDEFMLGLSSLRIAPQGGEEMIYAHPAWPALEGRTPIRPLQTEVPVLLMNGDLDPQTPYENAELLKQELTHPHQRLVVLDGMPHETLINSWTTRSGEPPCGFQLVAGFVRDPRGELDTSCADRLAPIEFEPDPEFTMQMLGTANATGD